MGPTLPAGHPEAGRTRPSLTRGDDGFGVYHSQARDPAARDAGAALSGGDAPVVGPWLPARRASMSAVPGTSSTDRALEHHRQLTSSITSDRTSTSSTVSSPPTLKCWKDRVLVMHVTSKRVRFPHALHR